MSLFQQSTTTLAQAKLLVADSAGKRDDATQLARAHTSLQAATRFWNKADRWDFTRTLATDVSMDGTTELADLPHDCRALYDVEIVGTGAVARPLWYVRRRYYDRTRRSELGNQDEYDLFVQGGLGKIRVLGLTSAATLRMRYYRRLSIPCALTGISATTTTGTTTITGAAGAFAGAQLGAAVTGSNVGAGAVVTAVTGTSITVSVVSTASGATTIAIGATTDFLDIPADYEDGLIAWATHHFLINNGESEVRLNYWQSYAAEVLARAKAENHYEEDEEVTFVAPADELA